MRKSLLFLLAAAALAQDQADYRPGARLVLVDVLVRNSKGPVGGLTKTDFELQDGGKTAAISFFRAIDGNAPAVKLADWMPGTASNRAGSNGEPSRLVTAVLFDRNNLSASEQAQVSRQILELLHTLKQTDRVAFYSVGEDLALVHDYSDDPLRLAKVSDHILGGQAAAQAGPDQLLQSSLEKALAPTQVAPSSQVRVGIMTRALQSVARHLSGLPGRKNLIWIASDFPLTFGNDPERRHDDEIEVSRATRILRDAAISVYAVDPPGASLPINQPVAAGEGQVMRARNGGGNSAATSTAAASYQGFQVLRMIAEDTGGRAIYTTNQVTREMRNILDETIVSYTLGFYPDEKKLNEATHDLNVKVAKKPETSGAKLSYRKSFFATKLLSPPHQVERTNMNQLATDPLEATDIGLKVIAYPAPATPTGLNVDVTVDIHDLQVQHQADHWVGAFDLGFALEGTPSASSPVVSAINLNLTEDQMKVALTSGLVVANTFAAPAQPGRLRVIVLDQNSGAAGSVKLSVKPR